MQKDYIYSVSRSTDVISSEMNGFAGVTGPIKWFNLWLCIMLSSSKCRCLRMLLGNYVQRTIWSTQDKCRAMYRQVEVWAELEEAQSLIQTTWVHTKWTTVRLDPILDKVSRFKAAQKKCSHYHMSTQRIQILGLNYVGKCPLQSVTDPLANWFCSSSSPSLGFTHHWALLLAHSISSSPYLYSYCLVFLPVVVIVKLFLVLIFIKSTSFTCWHHHLALHWLVLH